MKKDKKIFIIGWCIVLLLTITYAFVDEHWRKNALKDGVIVTGTITSFFVTQGSIEVRVDYSYQGKLIHGTFYTYNIDTLERNEKLRLLISKQYPDKYIQCLGAAK